MNLHLKKNAAAKKKLYNIHTISISDFGYFQGVVGTTESFLSGNLLWAGFLGIVLQSIFYETLLFPLQDYCRLSSLPTSVY
jgi:hypothetical protein